ncbi:hypothetical protein GY45DRAFT_1318315 [Cubamyces sp. BRFM 1775]|nr:hypothetical protein GY45DRAFT_1318315 [Cubamyces sp. BRFM 1775]
MAAPCPQPGSEANALTVLGGVSSDSDILHDPDFWFNDGNIVIVAKNHHADARPTGFRVHMGVMSRHSEVFKDLLCQSLPRPKEGEGSVTIEGCPQMLVTDSYFDFTHLLHALYDGIGYLAEPESVGFGGLAALVRLGHKYDIAPVYNAALTRLRAAFDDRAFWVDPPNQDKAADQRWMPDLWEALIAVNLFRTIAADDLRAIALYISTTLLDAGQLIGGAEREDGFIERLADDDLARCFEARLSLFTRRLTYINDTLTEPPRPGCESNYQCGNHVQALLPRKRTYSYANLMGRRLVPCIPWSTEGVQLLCARCVDFFKQREQQFLEKVWSDLPEIMSIPRPTPPEPVAPSEVTNTTTVAA